jgi:hypothetical protein
MIKVVLFGDRNDTSLTLPFCRCLERHGGVLYLGAGCIAEYSPRKTDFVLIETDFIESYNAENSIFVVKSPKLLHRLDFISNENYIIISEYSENVCKGGKPVVLCSTGSKGDILLSSLNKSGACISVEHCLTTLTGKRLAPCEFKVKTDVDIMGFSLLALCGILILSEKNKEFFINL